MALGALIIKARLGVTDEEFVEQIVRHGLNLIRAFETEEHDQDDSNSLLLP